jgi:quercetin dioxygenase-like cupin family protein
MSGAVDELAGTLKRTELQRSASSIPGREIVQVLTEIPAGVESGWHQHPGEEVGYILAGTVEMHLRDQPTLTLHAGDPPAPHAAQRDRPRSRDRPHAVDLHRRARRAARDLRPMT